ncbi:MAG: GNAT family N-acetyltransferase [Actinomycetota bacterium]|nr:GNAT family N-acetyltransferase [Actinomycetota bacterium]
MEIAIRPARAEDKEAVAVFTHHTFPWGDYVTGVFDDWLRDPKGRVMVACDPADRAVGMARVTLLSPREAWAQGARIHPGFRRQGIGKRLNDALCAWAAQRGARVMRLAVEEWNQPARGQVAQLAYRPVSQWVFAAGALADASPVAGGDGGQRVPGPERLEPATSSEAEPAYFAWARSGLARAARELFPLGWSWRSLTLQDVAAAARAGGLWAARCGWAISEPSREALRVSWVSTAPEDAAAMTRALVDRGIDMGAERVEVMAPAVSWLTEPLRRAAPDLHPLVVYAKPIG